MIPACVVFIGDTILMGEIRDQGMKGSDIRIVFYKRLIIQNELARKGREVGNDNQDRQKKIRQKIKVFFSVRRQTVAFVKECRYF